MTKSNKPIKQFFNNPKYIHSFVAKQYFVEMKTKSEIADDLGISRFKVARLITEAIEKEYVRFTFPKQHLLDDEISQNICQKYNLKHAIVLSMMDSSEDQLQLNEKLGQITADYLTSILKKDMKVGVAWGRVLSSTINHLHDIPPLDVIQLSGVHPQIEFNQGPIDLIHKMAAISQGKAHPIYLPMWVENEELKSQLISDPYITEACSLYSKLDIILTGIGSWKSGASSLFNIFPEEWKNELIHKDVCADVCISLIDSKGNILDNPIDHLGFGITSEQLKEAKNIIGIAGGKEKYEAILAALKSGLLSTLITDFNTAIKLLSE